MCHLVSILASLFSPYADFTLCEKASWEEVLLFSFKEVTGVFISSVAHRPNNAWSSMPAQLFVF